MIDADYLAKAKYYGNQMIALKEITQVPDYSTFINTSFLRSNSPPAAGRKPA